jgi:outer membrane protein assembly complex protein YaeT
MRLLRPSLVVLLLFLSMGAACPEQGSGVRVKSLKFTGTKAVSDGQLRSVLATAVSSRIPWGDKQYFDREQFEADLKRIIAYYQDRGYPNAKIASFDAKLSPNQKSVSIRINIDEGEPIRVERVVLEGFDPLPPAHLRALESRLPLRAGAALDRGLEQASREAALDELKDHGYPSPKVAVEESVGSSEQARVVTYTAQPGRIAYVGQTEIQGESSVEERIVRRQLTYRRGQLFEVSKLRESQRNLYSLELFNFVNVEAQTAEAAKDPNRAGADEIPTRVTVTEGKHRRVNFGFGYGSEEHARAQVDWRHVNFFGGARTAGVVARYSGFEQGARINFKQPYLFNPHYSFTLSGQTWWNNEPDLFERRQIGGRATITREFSRGRSPILGKDAVMNLSLTYADEWEDYTISNKALADLTFRDELIALGFDPRCGKGPRCFAGAGQNSAVLFDAGRNTTGNILNAKKGYLATLHLETAGGWLGGDFNYRELTGEGRFYQSFGDRAVVAVRARAGAIDSTRVITAGPDGAPATDEPVPFFKRYFLGGSTSLRGWGRYEVSPLSASGLTIGGQSFLALSTEVRVPIRGNLSGVLFLDGGNVWRNPSDIEFANLRYDVGPGLRYDTRIGPIRLDVGYQLNPIPGLLVNGAEQTRRFRIHFSIGQAF